MKGCSPTKFCAKFWEFIDQLSYVSKREGCCEIQTRRPVICLSFKWSVHRENHIYCRVVFVDKVQKHALLISAHFVVFFLGVI